MLNQHIFSLIAAEGKRECLSCWSVTDPTDKGQEEEFSPHFFILIADSCLIVAHHTSMSCIFNCHVKLSESLIIFQPFPGLTVRNKSLGLVTEGAVDPISAKCLIFPLN